MKTYQKQWEGNGKVYPMKSSAIKAVTISVTASPINMADYVTETTSVSFDEEERDVVKMTNDEYFVSDRIMITR